jgi:U3 small nucleolar ribonucleoprotein protein IMP4
MLRKTVRLRKEYLLKKGLQQQEVLKTEKKKRLKAALDSHQPVPTDLRAEEHELRHEIELEDEVSMIPRTHMDDEYADAGVKDPKILITTSRKPSSRLLQFLKELKIVLPNSVRTNRGNYIMKDLVDIALKYEFSDLIILHEHRGTPDGIIISHMPSGPTAYFGLSEVVLRHDLHTRLETMSEEYPNLIFDGFNSKIGERVSDILKYLFPVPKLDSHRVISFINRDDVIVFRNHTHSKADYRTVDLNEVGPRFNMRLYQITLGTVEISHAQKEWVLRPYMNTAKKRKVL